MEREPEPWQTNAPGAFLTIGEVSVWALGGDHFRVDSARCLKRSRASSARKHSRTSSPPSDGRRLRDTGRAMPEESTTPDLVELMRRGFEAANRRDVDAAASFYAPDAVYESVGMGASFEGVAAIREYLGDFVGAYDEFGVEAEEILDLGNGVTFAVVNQEGPSSWQQR